jgi:hypothetical protein
MEISDINSRSWFSIKNQSIAGLILNIFLFVSLLSFLKETIGAQRFCAELCNLVKFHTFLNCLTCYY